EGGPGPDVVAAATRDRLPSATLSSVTAGARADGGDRGRRPSGAASAGPAGPLTDRLSATLARAERPRPERSSLRCPGRAAGPHPRLRPRSELARARCSSGDRYRSARSDMTVPHNFRAGALSVLGLGLGLTGCAAPPPEAPPAAPTQVSVSYPVEREVTDHADYTGRTAAVDSVEVRAHVW